MKPEDRIKDEEIVDILEDAVEEVEEDAVDDGPQPMDEQDIKAIIKDAVQDAIDFISAEISEDRIKAQRYYDGEVDLGHEEGRSKVVATKVRDTIRAIKPSLMRIFLSSGRYGEFIPKGPEDVKRAEQQTEAAHQKLEENNGFKVLSDAFHDALLKKNGIVKVYYEEYDHGEIHTFTGLNEAQYQAVIMAEGVEVLSVEQETTESATQVDDMAQVMPPETSYDVKVMRRRQKGDLCVVSVPPEEFFIDRNARSIDDFYVCGHQNEMRVGDLVAMGYDYDDVKDLSGRGDDGDVNLQEEFERRGYSTDGSDENAADPTMKNVLVTEAYMRMDIDGTGVPILHKFILGGSEYEVLSYDPCDDAPFAVFEVDPEPHTFFGRSLADILVDDQDAATSIIRGILDNVSMVNNPRLGVLENQVELDDVLNNEIGAVIRMKNPNAVMPITVPFTAAQTLTALQYMDGMTEEKTGVLKASGGLSPDALQSTTAAAVSATVQAAAGQIEVMARNLAEGGVKRLLKLILSNLTKHPDAMNYLRMNGEYTQVDPRDWDTSFDLSVNVGLGTGQMEQKAAMYREILALQMQVYQGYGPQNGVVGLSHIRNTVADLVATGGIRNAERYFAPVTPEYEQQLAMQQAQQAQGQQASDPNAAFLQAEQMKAMTKAQSDMARMQLDGQKAMMQDDRERDKMAQDFALKQAELQGKLGIQADAAVLKAEQERNRYGQ